MADIDALQEFGADVNEALARCMNNKDFYIRLVRMAVSDKNFNALADAVARKDKAAAFEAAHALKGVFGNLSLKPLYSPISKMTELLRGGADADYDAMLRGILEKKEKLEALLNG